MMTNLGIVVAVSDYSGEANPLPGCARDGEAIANVLRSELRFEDVLVITDDTKSGSVKARLIEFLAKHKGKEIGDLVFYFTGHGDFVGQEFYYLLTDYEQKRRKQTALENSEIDNLVRGLNPELFVKIVDACHFRCFLHQKFRRNKRLLQERDRSIQEIIFHVFFTVRSIFVSR
jgi:Caspase domain